MKTSGYIRFAALLSIVLLVSACSSGGASGPPTILRVELSETSGMPGTPISASADVEGKATSWEWEFGDGAYPRTSADANPSVRLARPGNYTGRVRATNEKGSTPEFTFTYTVSIPDAPTFSTGVVSASSVGVPAVPRGGQPQLWQIGSSLQLATALDRPSNQPDYQERGASLYSASAAGATGDREWTAHKVTLEQPPTQGFFSSFDLAMDSTSLMIVIAQNGQFVVAKSNTAVPTDAGDWLIYDVPVANGSTESFSAIDLIYFRGRWIVAQSEGTREFFESALFLAISTNANPQSAADWTTGQLTGGRTGETPFAMSVVREYLVLGLRGEGGDSNPGEMLISQTPSLDANQWTHVTFPVRSLGFVGAFDSAEAVSVIFQGGEVRDPGHDVLESGAIKVARTEIFPPNGLSDWEVYTIGEPGYAWDTDLETINGFPTVCFIRQFPHNQVDISIDREVILRAFTPDPRGSEDWFSTNLGTTEILTDPDLVAGQIGGGPVRLIGRPVDGNLILAEADFGW